MTFETPILIKENIVMPLFSPAFIKKLEDAVEAYTEFANLYCNELTDEDKQLVQDTIELSREIICINEAQIAEGKTLDLQNESKRAVSPNLKPFMSFSNLSRAESCVDNIKQLASMFTMLEEKTETLSDALSFIIEFNLWLYCTSDETATGFPPNTPGAEYAFPSKNEHFFYSLYKMFQTFAIVWLLFNTLSGSYKTTPLQEYAIPMIAVIFAVICHGIRFVLRCNRLEKLEQIQKSKDK